MFERILDSLQKKLGQYTRYAAPAVAGADVAETLRSDLEEFYGRSASRFRRLFLNGKPLLIKPHERPWFEEYERAGLVKKKAAAVYIACAHVFPLNGAMIATDLPTHRDRDQVFSLTLEQVYIVAQMGVRSGDRALELCVGSGVNSLFMTDVAASVTGVDVSPRALDFARFNAAVNPGGTKLDLRLGSLFEPLGADEQFDFVLVNPPFEPVPPGADHFFHSHGGEDGLDVVREILAKVKDHLAPRGRFEMFTWSPGDDRSVHVADLLREAFPDRRIEVDLVDFRPLDERIRQFRKVKGFAKWRERLRATGYTRISGVFVSVEADGPAEVVVLERPEVLEASLEIVHEWR